MDNSDEIKDRLYEILGWWVNEFKTQTGHMTCILAMIICLLIESPRNAVIWAVLFAIYYAVLFFTGKRRVELVFDLKDRSKLSENKRKYKWMYLMATLILFVVGSFMTGFITAFLVFIIIGTISFLYYLFDVDSNIEVLYERDCRENNKVTNNFDKLKKFSDKHPVIYEGIYYLSMLCLIVIPTLFLPYAWWIKVLIVVGYIAIVPFISLFADSGASITEIFDFQDL